MKKKTWLEKATLEKAHREEYAVVHGNLAADGYRLHYDPSLPVENSDFVEHATNCVLESARKSNQTEFTLTTAALVTACKQAIAIGRGSRPCDDFTPSLYISVNGSLQYQAKCEGNGEISGEWTTHTFQTTRRPSFPVVSTYKTGYDLKCYTCKVEYAHTGRDVEFAINPRYLLDALSGMETDTITIRVQARNAPIYLTDGTREAVIMPIAS